MAKKGGLGRGLSALMVDNTTENANEVITLRLSDVIPNREQPRKVFEEGALSELAESISRYGVLQPLMVRPMTDGGYQLVAGERRWRAARIAGLTEVPVVIREMDDAQAAQIALVENLQREDLNPVEEAVGYRTLMENYGLTQEETAAAVGKSRPAVANAMRLLALPEQVLDMVSAGRISAGHGRALLTAGTAEQQAALAAEVEQQGLSVREIERLVKKKTSDARVHDKSGKDEASAAFSRDSYFDEVELALTAHLGRKVKVTASGKGGLLQIEFYSKDDLRMLANEFEESKNLYIG